METNKLKKFAQEARVKLLQQIEGRLNYILLNKNTSTELLGKAQAVKALEKAISSSNLGTVVEKTAYTWFNRLIALRFMDANGYQPLGIKVVSSATGNSHIPELLDEVNSGRIPSGLKVDEKLILDILDGRVASTNPDNEVYRMLLVAACNGLHEIFPFLFEEINDYTELLLPEDLTSDKSIIYDVVKGMDDESCAEVEIIGWLYQFYISERKDEVFASKGKVKKEDIPAATQLFTPRWIVEYMVQNTVGKLWLQNNPQSSLKDHMPYYIESPSTDSTDYLKIESPEEITLLDQACGSGHILVYGFELLSKIYEEEGYSPSEIPALIIKNNLFGFEIDDRASQLAGMAIMMKAREYHRRFFRKGNVPEPNILCYQDLTLSDDEVNSVFKKLSIKPSDELIYDLGNMRQATNFGSLIIPHSSALEIHQALEATLKLKKTGDAFIQYQADQLHIALEQLGLLARKYHCVVDNPPYMGGSNANKELSEFLKTNYPDSKADLMACFMETGLAVLYPKGFIGMINQHSWMFLSSYEKLRAKLIESTFFDTLLHLGPRTFPEIGGEVVQNASFTFWNNLIVGSGVYLRLTDFDNSELKKQKTIEAKSELNTSIVFKTNQSDYKKIVGFPICYWPSNSFYDSFDKFPALDEVGFIDGKNVTANNDRFLRFNWEVGKGKFLNKFIPIAKGGDFRKWQGNTLHLIDWSDGARKNYRKTNSGRLIKESLWYKEGLTFSRMSKVVNCRFVDSRGTFDGTTVTFFLKPPYDLDIQLLLQAFFNSSVGNYFVKILNPTLVFQFIDIKKIPIPINSSIDLDLIKKCNQISTQEWNTKEIGIDFTQNELLRIGGDDLLDAYESYEQYWTNRFRELHFNESELNREFIKLYELEGELDYQVNKEEITILNEVVEVNNGEIFFRKKEVLMELISYSIGCMFGRFSLDKVGPILANQGETLQDYLLKVDQSEHEICFLPDDDNIIPVLDDEWFEDDIVGRFYEFLKASFGDKNFVKNLQFVEDCLGRDIRKYLTKDFYKDHIKRYKKRPIYWMFSSPQGHFKVLVYLHRYTPDTLSRILNNYLREFMSKLSREKERQQDIVVTGAPREQAKALKEIDKIEKQIDDCLQYEAILRELALERIELDLDDGVLVNYNKMGKAVAIVPGLNDTKAKKKVRGFDWIDTTQIR